MELSSEVILILASLWRKVGPSVLEPGDPWGCRRWSAHEDVNPQDIQNEYPHFR